MRPVTGGYWGHDLYRCSRRTPRAGNKSQFAILVVKRDFGIPIWSLARSRSVPKQIQKEYNEHHEPTKHQNQHGFAPFAPPTKRYQSIITYGNITILVMIFQLTPLRVDGNRFLVPRCTIALITALMSCQHNFHVYQTVKGNKGNKT